MRPTSHIKEEHKEIPELEFPVCIKQGDSYFRYHSDGRFENISVRLSGLNHIQTSYSFGKLTWLSDYNQEIKTIIRRHGEISQNDFIAVIDRYFNYEHDVFFKEKEVQADGLKVENNHFPENEIFTNTNVIQDNDEPF